MDQDLDATGVSTSWAFIGWGLGIAVHGLVVRLNRPASAAPTWEQRQIDKVMAG